MKKPHIKKTLVRAAGLINFVALVTLYVLYHAYRKAYRRLRKSKSSNPPLTRVYYALVRKMDTMRPGSLSRINLIELALQNMADKKTRTWITMGGMAIGIGLIVLLVSIGYGLEQLVISRVARLEELRQADVVPGLSEDLLLTDKSVAQFKEIPGVADAIPVISAVGKINYNNSETDMAVYGVTSTYLQESAIKPSTGKVFDSNELSVSKSTEADKEVSLDLHNSSGDYAVTYTLQEGNWYRVRGEPDPDSEIIGFTRVIEGPAKGEEVEGKEYTWEGKVEKKWIKASVPLWEKRDCTAEESCEGGQYAPLIDKGAQVKKEGYMAEIAMDISYSENKVTSSPTPASTVLGLETDGSLPVVEIASLSGKAAQNDVKTVPIGGRDTKEIVINKSALKILGLEEGKAVGSVIKISFVIVGGGAENTAIKIQSNEADYTIIGVIDDESTPILYVPFIDLRSLGVEAYAQVKVVSKDKESLPKVRATIESMGYGTLSVIDTVGQIDKLFATARTFLATLGVVALSVAALGMFNTLTVSLLERTHEVGLMKAIGMKSSEVKELFMTESMIMGFFGGIMGLILGIAAGFILSVVLSLISVTKGVGFLNITHVPLTFALLIIGISLLVGVGTGYIPARRATRISALDALRYE